MSGNYHRQASIGHTAPGTSRPGKAGSSMEFWRVANRAAAHEFGRRHYRGVIGVQVAKRLFPAVATGAVAAGIVWALVKGWRLWAHAAAHQHLSFGWAHTLLPVLVVVAVAAVVIGVVVFAARRWMWLIDGFLPLEHGGVWAVAVVVALVAGVGGVAWMVT